LFQTSVARIVSSTLPARKVAEGINSEEDFAMLSQTLVGQVNVLEFEFATLVSRNCTVQIGANNDRRGELFDPSGVASKAMELGATLAVTVKMNYSEFSEEGAPRFL
jgi:hypothetical protein